MSTVELVTAGSGRVLNVSLSRGPYPGRVPTAATRPLRFDDKSIAVHHKRPGTAQPKSQSLIHFKDGIASDFK